MHLIGKAVLKEYNIAVQRSDIMTTDASACASHARV